MKKIKIMLLIIILITFFSQIVFGFSNLNIESPSFETGVVSAKKLNLRSGPGITFKILNTLDKNTEVLMIAKISDWYIVQAPDGSIGTVFSSYIKDINEISQTQLEEIPETISSEDVVTSSETILNYTSTEEELNLINKINTIRLENNLPELKISAELQNTAKLKAVDLVENNYFSHDSEQYGNPFEMLESFNIPFTIAAENISGNSSIDGAIDAWKGSENHLKNILNANYAYTGVGIVESEKYGKIFVQLFTD